MSIIIKELFESDLDQYNNDWWSSKKIEKLNFNFDQILISGGGPSGPRGFIGDQGLDGAKGPIGPQGVVGSQGLIGSQGVDGKTVWLKNQVLNQKTTLKINQFNKSKSTNLLLGIDNTSAEYNTTEINVLNKIHTKGGSIKKNIIFSDDETDKTVYLNIFKEGTDIILEYGFNDATNTEFELIGDEAVLSNNVNPSLNSTFGNFKDSLFKIKTFNSTFGDITETNEIQGSTKFNTETPKVNWIAQSADANGKIKWIDPIKVIPGFPVGSIIAINAAQFNNNNFLINEIKTIASGYLQITNGSGKTDTMYQGWYICNGKTWKKGAIAYDLPNLNSYSYDIAADTSGNSSQTHTNNVVDKLPILGGSDLKLNITQSSGSYSSSYNNHETTNQTEIFNSNGSLSQSDAKLIYICYLKETNMYWEDADVIQPTPTLYDVNLSFSPISRAEACSNQVAAYKIDFDPTVWINLSANLSGKIIYNSDGNAIATDGYYSKGGIVRTFVSGSFVHVENCPTSNSFTAALASNMFKLNGVSTPFIGGSNITIYTDNSDFTTATKIYTSSSLTSQYYASSGWYRIDSTRRYWSQSDGMFLGINVFGDYIHNLLQSQNEPIGDLMAKAASTFNYCNGVYDESIYVYTTSADTFMNSTNTTISPVYKNLYNVSSDQGYTPLELIENNAHYGPENDLFSRRCGVAGTLQARQKCNNLNEQPF